MSVIGNPLLLGGDAGAPSFTTERSVRLRSSASAYFNRTPASTTNQKVMTFSAWVKRGTLSSSGLFPIFGNAAASPDYIGFYQDSFRISFSGGTYYYQTSAVYRDPSAWYHIVVSLDTTQATASNRVLLWINGIAVTSFTSSVIPQNGNTSWNLSGTASYIGQVSSNYLDGYLTEINFIDGQALTPSSFGEYDAVRNTQWKPKAYSGSWGTNGFYLKFANPASIGLDSSGNGNNWTASAGIQTSNSALETYDSMFDVPTLTSETASNFCTWSPVAGTNISTFLSGGNLNFIDASNSGTWRTTFSTMNVSTGKYYHEMKFPTSLGSSAGNLLQFSRLNTTTSNPPANSGTINYGVYWNQTGTLTDSTQTISIGTIAANDILMLAIDVANGRLWVGKNGTWFSGNPATNTSPSVTWTPYEGAWSQSVFSNNAGGGGTTGGYTNFGQRPFTYTPPTGFKSLNNYNLLEPAIDSPDDYHKVYTYTGNGGGQQVGEIQKPASLFNLDRSLRFKGTNSYFDKVFASGGANTKGTISMWVKRGKLGVQQELFRFGTTGTLFSGLLFSSTDTMSFVRLNSTYQVNIATTRVFKDPSLWYHIVVAWDTTLATASDRVKIYVNGIQETVFASATYPTQNLDMYFFTAGTHNIGRYPVGGNYFGGYMAEFHAVDGTQLTANDFGQFDGNYYWTPKDYTGGYGTNGWHLDFEDYSSMSATGIGKDVSGLGNNFTPYNFNVTTPANTNTDWDSMVDVPTLTSADVANFATWSPFNTGQSSTTTSTLSNGNLLATGGAINTTWSAVSTIVLPTTGKWYFEAEMSATSYGNGAFGIFALGSSTINAYAQLGVGTRVNDNVLYTYTSYNTASPNRIGIAYDADNGLLWQTDINGNWLNSKVPAVDTTGLVRGITKRDDYVIGWRYNSGAETNRTCSLNCGQKPFFYTPPTGFKSLNSFNVAEVTGDLESPDFVWIKSRSAATNHALFNSVTGVGKYLSSNATTAETTDVNSLIQFNKNGFLLGNAAIVNTSAATYVASAWKVAATTVANTDGTIASQVRANPTAGISVVTYTGTGANATVGHGLGVAPSLVIVKNRDFASGNWISWHKSLLATQVIWLNVTNAAQANTGFNNTAPTSSVFSVGTTTESNGSTNRLVAYCFSEIAGYSKFGSYTGNGSTDGPFVYTGFRPRWVMIKRTDTTADWIIWDTERSTINAATANLYPDLSNVEYSDPSVALDFLSNGFKLRNTNIARNASGGTYIFAAFAEHPFKYSLGR